MPLLLLSLLALLPPALANEDGVVGRAQSGCAEECHGLASPEVLTATLLADHSPVAGGETVQITLRLSSTDPTHGAAGLDVAASAGTLVPSAGLLWRKYELTHQYPQPLSDGAIDIVFAWTAPLYAGEQTLFAAGNTVNRDKHPEGDAWTLTQLRLDVESDCLDLDGDGVGDCEGDCDDTDPERSAPEDCAPPDSGGDGGGTPLGGEDGGAEPPASAAPGKGGCDSSGQPAPLLALSPLAAGLFARRRGSGQRVPARERWGPPRPLR